MPEGKCLLLSPARSAPVVPQRRSSRVAAVHAAGQWTNLHAVRPSTPCFQHLPLPAALPRSTPLWRGVPAGLSWRGNLPCNTERSAGVACSMPRLKCQGRQILYQPAHTPYSLHHAPASSRARDSHVIPLDLLSPAARTSPLTAPRGSFARRTSVCPDSLLLGRREATPPHCGPHRQQKTSRRAGGARPRIADAA